MAWHEFEIIFLFTTIVIRIQTKSDLFKNSTSPGKKAGVLEWVCNFEYVTKSKMLGVDSLIYEEDFDGENPETLTQLTKAHFELMVKRIKELDEYASI